LKSYTKILLFPSKSSGLLLYLSFSRQVVLYVTELGDLESIFYAAGLQVRYRCRYLCWCAGYFNIR